MSDANNYDQMLADWREVQSQMAVLKDKEAALRKVLFEHYFAQPTEGTNTVELGGGWKLKGKYTINRKIDETALPAVREKLGEVGISLDPIIRWSPDLEMRAYRAMSDATKAIFDQCLTIKPGMPALELVPPPAPKK